jgi:phosphoesterase RecJ-like protein
LWFIIDVETVLITVIQRLTTFNANNGDKLSKQPLIGYLCPLFFKGYMLTDRQIAEIRTYLSAKRKITLTTHMNPDGDAIGSVIAMMHYLRKKGHEVKAVIPNNFPRFYSWLPGSDELIVYEKQVAAAKAALNEAEMIFLLDLNAFNRVGQMTELLKSAPGKKFLIDHHISPEEGFDYYFSTTETSSTGELVYDFMEIMGDLALLDRDIAAALYVSIMTDTGSFSFASNHPKTYYVAAALIEQGIDAERIHRLVYDTFSENRLRLLGYAISERLLVWPHLHTAVIYLTKEDLKKFNYQVGDTEGIVNYPLSMAGVNLSVLITEKDRKIKLSLRSKGEFSVNDLARSYFNGGGHRNAAGGHVYDTVELTIEKLKSVLEKYKEELNYKLSY